MNMSLALECAYMGAFMVFMERVCFCMYVCMPIRFQFLYTNKTRLTHAFRQKINDTFKMDPWLAKANAHDKQTKYFSISILYDFVVSFFFFFYISTRQSCHQTK